MNHYRGRVKFPTEGMYRNYMEHMIKWGKVRAPSLAVARETPSVVDKLLEIHRRWHLGAELRADDEEFVWEKR